MKVFFNIYDNSERVNMQGDPLTNISDAEAFSSNSEADASEILGNIEDMLLRGQCVTDIFI